MTGTPVRLFYDAGCGPCSFFAHVSRSAAHRKIAIFPLTGPEGDRWLGEMPEDRRYDSFHLAIGGRLLSAADALPSLVGLVAGRAAERTYRAATPIRRAGDRLYWRFWRARRAGRCAAGDQPRAGS